MSNRQERFRRAAHKLREAHTALDNIRIKDLSANNVEGVKELQEDMYGWKSNFENWADDADREETEE